MLAFRDPKYVLGLILQLVAALGEDVLATTSTKVERKTFVCLDTPEPPDL